MTAQPTRCGPDCTRGAGHTGPCQGPVENESEATG